MRLVYSDRGIGPAVVLLHAFPLSRDLWRDVVTPIADSGWRVITPDLPGFGGSRIPVESIAEMAAAVAGLLDELGVHSAVVGGCSMGGYVALSFAEQFPERVAGLMLVDTKASADTEEARANRHRIAEQVEAARSTVALARTMPEALLGPTTRAARPELVEWAQEQIITSSMVGVAAAQRAMADRSEQFDTLSRLRVPVLSIRGAEDGVSTAADHAAMVAVLQDGIDVVVPESGHLLPIEQPGAFVGHVIPFLARVRGPHC